MSHMNEMNPELRECIEACFRCEASCLETVTHCLMMGGEHASREHQTLLQDCADACRTSARLMLRLSPRHARYCDLCADLCRDCAEECDRIGKGDATMTRCAALCRQCAAACYQMARVMA